MILPGHIVSVFMTAMILLSNIAEAALPKVSDVYKLIGESKYETADSLLKSHVAFYSQQYPDSLANYILPMAQILLHTQNTEQVRKKLESFAHLAINQSQNPQVRIQVNMYLADFYNSVSEEKTAYDYYLTADTLAAKEKIQDYRQRALIQNNLSTTAFRMNKMELFALHSRQAEYLAKKSTKADGYILYLIYNSKANTFYYSYILDSAGYYYLKAAEYLKKSDKDDLQKKYSGAILNNNLAGIYNIQGKTSESIAAMQQAINDLSYYTEHPGTVENKTKSLEFLFEAMDNLAGIYKSIGDYHRALHLLLYSYQRKKEELPSTSSAVFKSEILIGQIFYALNDYTQAKKYLLQGLRKIPSKESGFDLWQADGNAALALVYDACKETENAKKYYNSADSLYRLVLQESFDDIYLGFLNSMALFYAENNELKKAVAIAQKPLNYTIEQEGENTLQSMINYVNLAKIYQKGSDNISAQKYSDKALSIAKNLLRNTSGTLLDSVRIETKTPEAVLLSAQSGYELQKNITPEYLDQTIEALLKSQDVFYRKQQLLSHEKDLNIVHHAQKRFSDFINHLYFKKYELSNDKSILNDIIQLHETAVYRKIRGNINRQDFIKFHNIPNSVQTEEKKLKSALTGTLNNEKSNQENLNSFFQAEKKWNEFQKFLKNKYPHYYAAKYQNDDHWNLSELLKNLPEGVSVVRYIFLEKDLYAYIITQDSQHWIPLKNDNLERRISLLSENSTSEMQVCQLAHQLYVDLWQPIEKHSTSRVIIIPEGILYYLSFDMLSKRAVQSYKELKQHALVNRYAFSYHYSLLALQDSQNKHPQTKGFIAFTPAFSDKEKALYRNAIDTHPVGIDNEYMLLLPLPFSVTLAKNAEKKFGGITYTGHQSTSHTFTNKAGNHSIIHIGTHAIANDEYPEFSKLIFAKDPAEPEKENTIYLYDIYQHDLSSDISVLTACETGKPGFFPGEGMISMAHAFMYAGSRSILTGLWKIDEQSTAKIIDIFYEKIALGLPKDLALQQAKIEYLQQTEGRLLQPQYWAGLVIMGDISAIDPGNFSSWKWMLAACTVILFIILTFIYYFRSKRSR